MSPASRSIWLSVASGHANSKFSRIDALYSAVSCATSVTACHRSCSAAVGQERPHDGAGPIRTVPLSGAISPARMRARVVLPEPVGPMITVIDPGVMSRSIPASTFRSASG